MDGGAVVGDFPNPLPTKDLRMATHYQPMLPQAFGSWTPYLNTIAHFDALFWNEVVVTQRIQCYA